MIPPSWLCWCGTRNRLRYRYCLHCGQPDYMQEDDDE